MTSLALPMSVLPMSAHPQAAAADHDAADLARLRAGDTGAAAGIWERHAAAVWRVAARCCPHPADAEDAMQEVALHLLRRPPRDIHGGGLRAWLCLAAASRARDRLRDEGRRQRRQAPLIDRPAAAPAAAPALAERALAALDGLPAAYREPVRLRCVERLEFPLVAAACGIGERTARTRVSRGLARLRAALGVPGTGLAGIALLLPVRPAPGMPTDLPGRLSELSIGAGTAGAGVLAATVAVGVAGIGVAALFAGGGDPAHGGSGGDDRAPASATMAALRVWRDPGAAAQAEVDLGRLRGPATATAPFSALRDPRAAAAVRDLRAAITAQVPQGSALRTRALEAAVATLERGSGAVAAWDPAGAVGMAAWEVDMPAGSATGGRIGTAVIHMTEGPLALAREGSRWILGDPVRLQAVHAARVTAAAPADPVWVRWDMGTVMTALAARGAGADGDTELLFGSGWANLRPVLTATAACDHRGWRGALRLTGARPVQPIRGIAALEARSRSLLGPFRSPDPGRRLADGAGDLLRFDAGLDLDDRGLAPEERADLAPLSGDCSLRIRPGRPMPRIDLVLGLDQEGGALVAALVASLGATPIDLPASGPWRQGGWSLPTPLGALVIRLGTGVLALTTDPAAAPVLVPGSPAADAELMVDGPACGPLLDLAIALAAQAERRDLAADLRRWRPLLPHLPRYRLALATTADGLSAEERGAPLLALAAAGLAWEVRPGATTPADVRTRIRQVLADPARRAVLERLARLPANRPAPGTLAERLRLTRVGAGELAAALGLPPTTPVERIGGRLPAGVPVVGFPLSDRWLTSRYAIDAEGRVEVVELAGDGRPRGPAQTVRLPGRGDGWQIPIGDGLAVFLVPPLIDAFIGPAATADGDF